MNRCSPVLVALCAALFPGVAPASSHMDAPLITLDDAANTTDVYAFVSNVKNRKMLTVALGVYPFEDPGIGPNRYNFGEGRNTLYSIGLSLGNDLAAGKCSAEYFFKFDTRIKSGKTILQSYTGVVKNVGDAAQNLTQEFAAAVIDYRPGGGYHDLGSGLVPPNNQGVATPDYNTSNGDGPAKDGVDSEAKLDRFTRQTVVDLNFGHRAFCGQREDGFYGDINAIFDLLSLRSTGKDSQRGFNLHMIVLQIPVALIGGDMQQVGVYATTSRRQVKVNYGNQDPVEFGPWVQVGRQGNPLFCEGFIAIEDKDRYNRTKPTEDGVLFAKYTETPELAKLLNAIVFKGSPIAGIETNRTDLVGIFIPDMIRVDLSTQPVPLAGGGASHPTNPDDPGFHRLSIFGGDTIFSPLQNQMIPSGWPNGRRFGDDVVDIGVSAVISDLRVNPPVIRTAGDNVDANDAVYHKVMPYAGTPLNGRNHRHD